MSISSQLPPISLAQASASLRALAQAAGQTVEARILSQSSNGTSQVQIGRQVLSLALPAGQVVGSTLTLSVQQADGQLRLGIVAVRPPPAAVSIPQSGPSAAPATTVQLSAAALASPSLASAGSPGASAAQPGPAAPVGSSGSSGGGVAAASGGAQRAVPGYGAQPLSPAVPGNPISSAPPSSPTGSPNGGLGATAPAGGTAPTQVQASATVPGGGAPAPAGAVAGQNGVLPAQPQAGAPGMPGGPGPTPQATTMQGATTPAAPTASPSTVLPTASGQMPIRADIPYAVATPAVVAPQTTALTGSAASGLPPVAQMAAGTMVGQHSPSPYAPPPNPPNAGAYSASAGPLAAPPPAAGSPQAAIAQMVQQAMPRQDSIVGLTTALTAIAGKVALPEPVAKAAQQVLAMRLPLDAGPLSGAGIKAAVQLSGVFQEALLASGQGQAAAGDLKSALMSLRQTLGAWLGNQAPVAQVSGLAPPIRGHVPRAKAGDGARPGLPDNPLEVGKALAERTDAALSRLRLHQNASLPDPSAHRQDAQWSMDLPVIVAGQQQVLHLQIQRDAEQEAERSEERSWQVRFAINLAERGEVGAQISLRAKNTGVLLWADQHETAQSLARAVDDLRETLGEAGLVASAIVVRAGAPAVEASQPIAGDGHVLDATR